MRPGSAWTTTCRSAWAGIPRSRVYRVIRKGEVRVNGKRADPETRLSVNDRIRIPPVRPAPGARAGQALGGAPGAHPRGHRLRGREDPGARQARRGGRARGQRGQLRRDRDAARAAGRRNPLELVHRLDRDTSGCLIVARKGAVLRDLHALLREDGFEKRYLALVKGKWDLGEKRIDVPLRTDTRVGGERTVRVADRRQGLGEHLPAGAVLRPHRHAGGGDARDRAHAPDPRARRACRAPGGRG